MEGSVQVEAGSYPIVVITSSIQRRRIICSSLPTALGTAHKVIPDTLVFLALSNSTCKAEVEDSTDRNLRINTVHLGVVQWLAILQMHYALP